MVLKWIAQGMRRVFLLAGIAGVATSVAADPVQGAEEGVQRIAFGSCARQGQPQPIWETIRSAAPDAFVFMGDNVYADTTDPDAMRAAYQSLADKPGFARLRETTPIFATWDDHDYGKNDAGAEFVAKAMAERVFLDFFEVAPDSPRRARDGVYGAYRLGSADRSIQLILLDTRYFRSPPKRRPIYQIPTHGKYKPNRDPEATVLGEAQWAWLADRLRQPAALHLIVSSIQVIPTQHRFEKWANFPLERARLFRVIRERGATGVVLLSGDRHLGEISVLPPDHEAGLGYPLIEVTASGLNAAGAGQGEANRFRVGDDNVRVDHFGLLQIQWGKPGRLSLQIRDEAGQVVAEHRVALTDLQP